MAVQNFVISASFVVFAVSPRTLLDLNRISLSLFFNGLVKFCNFCSFRNYRYFVEGLLWPHLPVFADLKAMICVLCFNFCRLFHEKSCHLSARETSSVLPQSQTSPRPPNVGIELTSANLAYQHWEAKKTAKCPINFENRRFLTIGACA